MKERKYQFSGTPDDFRLAIVDMKRAGLLDETGAGLDAPHKKRVVDRRGASIYYEALGRDATTLLTVAGDDVRTWEIVRDYLLDRQWKISFIPVRVQDARLHPFVDPSTIKNRKHQRLIELLIDRWLGRNHLSNDEIADEAGVGRSQFYAIQKKYTVGSSEKQTEAGL